MLHKYYASSTGVPTTVLIAEAIRDARRVHDGGKWELDCIDEFHSEMTDEHGNVDIEAKVVVRKVPRFE